MSGGVETIRVSLHCPPFHVRLHVLALVSLSPCCGSILDRLLGVIIDLCTVVRGGLCLWYRWGYKTLILFASKYVRYGPLFETQTSSQNQEQNKPKL